MSDRPLPHIGDLNPLIQDVVSRKFNPRTDNFTDSLRALLLDSFRQGKVLDKEGHFIGVVLRINASANKTNVESAISNDPVQQNNPLLSCVIRIPEIHSAIPEPSDFGTALGPHQGVIDLHPSFVAATKEISDKGVSVGDWVYCDWRDRKTFTEPQFFGRITDVPSPGQMSGENQEKKELFQSGGDPQTNPQEMQSMPDSIPSPPSRFEKGFMYGESIGMVEIKDFPPEYSVGKVYVPAEHYDVLLELCKKGEAQVGKGAIRITSGFRTMADQIRISGKKGDLASKPGYSPHQSSLAVDFDTRRTNLSKQYTFLAQECPKIGLVNVGRFFKKTEFWHWEFIGPKGNSRAISRCKNDIRKTVDEMRNDFL